MIKRLDNIGIAVQDVRRTIDFYTQKLGFEGEARQHDGSLRIADMSFYIFETKARNDVGRSVAPASRENPVGIDHLSFEVDDVEKAGPELEAKGIQFLGPIIGERGQFRYRGFHDPDGNLLYIIERAH